MTDQVQPSIWERSTLVRFFRWLFSWRGIRRILIVLAWTATIIALFYGEENWRGRRAWNKYRHELEARGERLDWGAFIPKPVPDEQNFAATPFIESWFSQKMNEDKQWDDIYDRAAARVPSSQDKSPRRFVDLGAWQMAFEAMRSGQTSQHQKFESDKFDAESRATAATGVLQGLETSGPRLAELRAASRRPYSRYPVIYDLENPWGILLPHLAKGKGACARLELKCCAELAMGQGNKALEDVKLMLYLVDSAKEEPFLISYLVRLRCLQMASQSIWEGLAEHRWSEAQLQELQTRLQQYNFVADLKRPLDAERASGILTVDLLYRQKYRLSTLGTESGSTPSDWTFADLVGRVAPHGWYHQEQLNYCMLYQIQLGGTFDASEKRVRPGKIESNAHEMERELSGGCLGRPLGPIIHHRVVASLLLPALDKAIWRTAAAQTAAEQATLACALERYRLAKGHFPENLEALVPQFIARLPKDLITGEPYRYRRTDDGQFVLYSVGWNEKDDGGVTGKTLYDDKQGDWVWQYPPK
jgi:hypothetical protein